MSEIKGVDFGCERALRAWCIKQALSLYDKYSANEAIETAEKIYDFVSGGKEAGQGSQEFQELKRLFERQVERIKAQIIDKSPAAFNPDLEAAAIALTCLFNGECMRYAKNVFSKAGEFIEQSHQIDATVFNSWLKAE